jgi:LacI family transcriptional regulator
MKMSEIARMANVSISTVSLALNDKPGVNEATKQRIMQIVDKYKYEPLRKRRTHQKGQLTNINFVAIKSSGIIGNNYANLPFFKELITFLSGYVSDLGILLTTNTYENVNIEKIDFSQFLSQNSGMIVLGTDLNESEAKFIHQQVNNLVIIDTSFPKLSIDTVTMDNFQGGYLAAKFLYEHGYRRIGYVASNKRVYNFSKRYIGFAKALAHYGHSLSSSSIYHVSPIAQDPSEEDRKILNVHRLPEVIFCEDDYIAIRMIKTANELGIKIPDQLAIMGFDGIYEGSLVSPELTTVHVPISQIAKQAVFQLQQRLIDSEKPSMKTLIATRLIERSSTGNISR